ncbi:hypothetical protein [Streptococcus ruminantium]|uniref:hypothetical protein n=2 Tax=Streptococcus ruminantium TaxID=1917441 RepID=UPI001D1555B1|nr:hypothetical protein [Streptococcus ruminantium]
MKKAMKYISTSLAALTLCVSILPSTASVYANTKGNPTPKTISTTDFPDVHLNDLTSEQRRKLTVIFTIGEELALTDNNELYLKHDTGFIKNKYNLSSEDIAFIIGSIANYNTKITTPVMIPRASFSGGYIHLSYGEVLNIVNLSASYGPGVIAGAMSALLSFYPGIGTVIGGIIGWVGAAAILQALNDAAFQKKGIKIGIGGIVAE